MLSVLGFIAIIVAAIYAYKTAKDYDRNAVLWALATFGIGIGLQLGLPIFIGVVVALVMMADGKSVAEIQESFGGLSAVIGIVCLVLSFVAMFLILRFLSTIPEEKPFIEPPRPPEHFN